MSRRQTNNTLAKVGAAGALTTAAAVAGWIAYSAIGIDHNLPLPPAIDADQERFVGQKSRFLNVYVDRSASGRPLVLIHSINAAGCSYEMRPLFQRYRSERPVYALDLPGFGSSERADRVYTPDLYADAILDLLTLKVKEPADVVALSLSSEFAARVALQHPELFHSLTLISPTGFTARENRRVSQRANEEGRSSFAYRLLSFPLWGKAFYDLLATRRSIHYFLDMSFVGPVDPGLEAYDYLTAHQPGARFAPLYFVSGALFTRDASESLYDQLTDVPVLALYDRDAFVRFDALAEVVDRHDNWHSARIAPTLGLPQFEQPDATALAINTFWSTLT
jgi:pimeloyl-ACP methyl ester carboxylesterase